MIGLTGIIQPVNDWFSFFHLQPPLGPTVPDQCRLSIDPLLRAYHEGKIDHGSGLPMSSLRNSAVDLLAPFRVVSASSDNPCAGLPKFPTIPLVCAQWSHLSSPVYPRELFQVHGSRPKRSVTRHLSRSAQMAFCILTGTPSGFPNGPNSLRSSIQTSDQPFDQPDAYSACCHCLPAVSTVFWDIVIPPYMKPTLLR